MADPTKYVPGYSFTDWQEANPADPLPANEVDDELASLELSIDEAVDAIKDVRRSDGALKNGIVTQDSLAPDVAAQVGIGIDAALVAAEAAQAAAEAAETGAEAQVVLATAQVVLATAQAEAAAASNAATAALLDSFDDRYLGPKAADPALDNDGNALLDGALYYNTTSNEMRFYDLGTATWVQIVIDGFNVKITAADTTPGFLNSKVVAGTGLTKTTNNPAANETLTLAIDFTAVATAAQGAKADTALQPTGSGALLTGVYKVLLSEVVALSGTSKSSSAIPAGTKRVTISFFEASLSGTSGYLIQLADSGGVENTGYIAIGTALSASAVGQLASTAGFPVHINLAARRLSGTLTLMLVDAATNTWSISGTMTYNDGGAQIGALLCSGTKALSAVLTGITITTVNGTDTFDAGSVSFICEGW